MVEPGTQVGRYEIQRKLGRGGMGTVYVAHDPLLGRMVAIKMFAGDLDVPDARERFSREARAAAALNHPSIVTVYDFGEFASQPYIVMEYVPGETMANVIRRKAPVSIADKLRWIEELCAGAGYAHQGSVVHRDIKPANLMIDRSGRLKILDFGIARMLGIASNTAVMIGTPGYMAPEQITGEPVDHRTDLFSIGVVFYELLSYSEPFPGDTLPQITHRIVSEEPAALSQLVPDLSPSIVAIVGQALKKRSAERFRDAESMRVAISRIRRQYESDDDFNTPTMPITRDSLPPAGARGTGSSRRRSTDSVGVAQMTPPPDPRRTDREALARRRVTQVEASLQLARTLLEQQKLDEALDACEQALTLDETHTGALELEQEIHTALRVREGIEVAADDSALTTAADSSAFKSNLIASRLLESQAVTRVHEEAFVVTGLPPASSEQRLNTPQPLPLTASVPATALPAVSAPAAIPASPAPPVAEIRDRPRVSVPQIAIAKDTRTLLIGAGVAALALVGLAAFVLLRGAGATGTAFVDAVPWANITSIRNEAGEQMPLPSPASTPVALALPAGTYQITLAGPSPDLKPETVTVVVTVGQTSAVPPLRFQSITVEEYFEQYLGGGAVSSPAPSGGTQ
jgi:eukaryotic-like serine/threonine-protein kinase